MQQADSHQWFERKNQANGQHSINLAAAILYDFGHLPLQRLFVEKHRCTTATVIAIGVQQSISANHTFQIARLLGTDLKYLRSEKRTRQEAPTNCSSFCPSFLPLPSQTSASQYHL